MKHFLKTGTQALADNDKQAAKILLRHLSLHNVPFNDPQEHSKLLGTTYNSEHFEGDENNSVRRIMVELKMLSVFGKHFCPEILLIHGRDAEGNVIYGNGVVLPKFDRAKNKEVLTNNLKNKKDKLRKLKIDFNLLILSFKDLKSIKGKSWEEKDDTLYSQELGETCYDAWSEGKFQSYENIQTRIRNNRQAREEIVKKIKEIKHEIKVINNDISLLLV